MPIATAQGRENAAAGYAAQAVVMSLHTADPGTTGADEVAGGAPAYARQPVTWTAGSVDGVYSATVPAFDVPATTVTHIGLWSSSGTFLDKLAVTVPEFLAQDTLTITSVTYTQS